MDDGDKKDEGGGEAVAVESKGETAEDEVKEEGIEEKDTEIEEATGEEVEEERVDEEVIELDMEEKEADPNSEALYRELESECIFIKKQRDELRSTVESQWKDVTKLNRRLLEYQKEISEKDEVLGMKESAEEDERCQRERVERLNVEADAFREEISRLTEDNEKLTSQVGNLRSQYSVSESSTLPLQYQVDQLKTEMDALTSHCRYLEDQLADCNTELSTTKQDHSTVINHFNVPETKFSK